MHCARIPSPLVGARAWEDTVDLFSVPLPPSFADEHWLRRQQVGCSVHLQTDVSFDGLQWPMAPAALDVYLNNTMKGRFIKARVGLCLFVAVVADSSTSFD